MSHFSVLVIGDEVEKKLAPYQENNEGTCPEEFLEFHDVEEEYREKYESGTRKEFFCSSNSSWGQEITKENFEKLRNAKIGDYIILKVKNKGMSYFEKGEHYHCYTLNKQHTFPEEHTWIRVVDILETSHPNNNICFTGEIRIVLINEPREIPMKEYYPGSFEKFIKKWAGYEKRDEKTGKYGYWENPNKKWDYYKIGGRYTGIFKLKRGWTHSKKSLYKNDTYVDQARKKDIDWEFMNNDPEEKQKLKEHWDEVIAGKGFYKPEYYIEKYGTKERYLQQAMAFHTYAVITEDGKWHAPGDVGWFGCSSDTIEENNKFQNTFFDKFIKDLPDDTLLTIVDCHI